MENDSSYPEFLPPKFDKHIEIHLLQSGFLSKYYVYRIIVAAYPTVATVTKAHHIPSRIPHKELSRNCSGFDL